MAAGLRFEVLDALVLLRRIHGDNIGIRDRPTARNDLLRVIRDHTEATCPDGWTFDPTSQEALLLNAALNPDARVAASSWEEWASKTELERAPFAEIASDPCGLRPPFPPRAGVQAAQ